MAAEATPTPTPPPLQVKVQCTVCCEAFNSEGPHAPLVLAGCGHTFCDSCLQGVSRTAASRTILCPTCRTPCNLDADVRRNWRLADVVAGEATLVLPSAPPAEHMVYAVASIPPPQPQPQPPSPPTETVPSATYSYLPFRVVREEAIRAAASAFACGDAETVRLAPVLVPFFAVVVAAQLRVQAMGDGSAGAAFTEEADTVRDGLVCAWAAEKERRLVEECFPPGQPVWDLATLRTASTAGTETLPWLPVAGAAAVGETQQPKLCPHIVPDDAIERFRVVCQTDSQRESEKRAAELRKTPAARGKRLQVNASARVARRRLVYIAFWSGTVGGVNSIFVDGVTARAGGEQPQSRRSAIAETIRKALHMH